MRPAVLLYNPAAGRGRPRRFLAALGEALRGGGFGTHAIATEGPGDATRLAAAAAEEGAEAVFVLGGDGTVREAAAGLLGGEVPLAILPGGTTNVLARALGLPPDALSAARVHATAPVRRLDVGLCAGVPFLMMASAGFDAFVLGRLDPQLKRRLGRAGIVLQGLRELRRYAWPRLELTVDGAQREASFAAVCNIPYYAGRYQLVPGARFDDRRLDLVTFSGDGYLDTLGFALDLARGRHLRRSDVTVSPVSEVVIHGPAGAHVQIDGDLCGERVPVTLTLAEATLPVLAPLGPPPGRV
ncbi:MAG TPA: diacylglycerol kinase family protein [Thermoanaerobaculia bacterium]|nr:diacylglycerol kinase family protein [Thermoanaerobaculia bacterium]